MFFNLIRMLKKSLLNTFDINSANGYSVICFIKQPDSFLHYWYLPKNTKASYVKI